MGGRALKSQGIETVRLNKEDYFQVKDKMENIFSELLLTKVEAIKAYNDKDSFGDLDLLVMHHNEFDYQVIVAFIHEYIEDNNYTFFQNSNVISFGLPVDNGIFQVDLLLTHKKDYETSHMYFSYNDLGMLIGLTAVQMGLHYSHTGLFKLLHLHNGKEKVILSKTPKEIIEYLGFDYVRFEQGFNNLEEIFVFVSEGKYFNPTFYMPQAIIKKE